MGVPPAEKIVIADVHPPGIAYLAVNHYHGSPTGILTVKKLFDLPMKAGGEPASYPAIQLELSRVYTTEEGADSAPQVVNTLVWDSTEVQQAWEEAETGSLSLYVHDILFGGGFVGFNASVEVALPSYADGLPGVEGTLNLRVMPDRDLWEVGVYGSADFAILNMEAELVITAYNNIPLPNKIYFYVGGFTPGINVDGMGIFWIQGAGGGVEGLADTVFLSSRVPPLKLIFSGQFALSVRPPWDMSCTAFSSPLCAPLCEMTSWAAFRI